LSRNGADSRLIIWSVRGGGNDKKRVRERDKIQQWWWGVGEGKAIDPRGECDPKGIN